MSEKVIKFQSENTTLRPLDRSDVSDTLKWKNDSSIYKYTLGYRFPVTKEMEEDWVNRIIEHNSENRVFFAIEESDSRQFIGYCELTNVDWVSRTAFFGIVIGAEEMRGQGHALAAMKMLFGYAFSELNLRKICLDVPAYNERAIDIYEELGFEKEGLLKEQVYLDDAYHDVLMMGLFKDGFKSE